MAVKHAQSPLAPKTTPTLPRIAGVKLAAAQSGVRYKDRDDVMLAVVPAGATIAGVLTRSKCSSAPVDWCRKNLARGKVRAIVVNAGNANAFTGKLGDKAVEESTRAVAQALGCPRNEVFMASTGVIGQPLDWEKIAAVVPAMIKGAREDGWAAAAASIMTTDTFPKLSTRQAKIGERTVTLNGFLKGSGMIAPDMATMLSCIFTDAAIAAEALQAQLSEGVENTFNAVTIDGDTSTSDTLIMFATGQADAPKISRAADPKAKAFKKALHDVLANLAEQVARDGEGARKLVEITVEGAVNKASARRIAMSIANSPLVKTAIAGEDANWGRVVMAVGKAGEPADRDKLSIWFGGIRVAHKGARDPGYNEAEVSAAMQKPEISLKVALGLGKGRDRVLTCDLTKEYVAINGDYRS